MKDYLNKLKEYIPEEKNFFKNIFKRYWIIIVGMMLATLSSLYYLDTSYTNARMTAARATGLALVIDDTISDIKRLQGRELERFLTDYKKKFKDISNYMYKGQVIPHGLFDIYIPTESGDYAYMRLINDDGELEETKVLDIVPEYAQYDDGLGCYLVLRYPYRDYVISVLIPASGVFLFCFIGLVFYIVKDISLKKKEQEFFTLEKFRDIADVSAGIAHNMRNYLSVIKLNSQLAQHNLKSKIDVPEDLERAFEKQYSMIMNNIELSSNVTTELLEFAKHTTEKEHMKEVGMFRIITNVADMFQESLEFHSNILVHLDFDPNYKEVYCMGNDNLFMNVLMNLFKNASESFKIIGQKSKNISVSVFINNNMCNITVTDNGCGMSEEVLARIKEPFFTAGKPNGTGLGVPAADRIITNMDGTLNYKSERGRGTIVCVALPVVNSLRKGK